jgi:hypothetical protein
MKIRPVEAELFHADGRDEAKSHFNNFLNAPKPPKQNDTTRKQTEGTYHNATFERATASPLTALHQ